MVKTRPEDSPPGPRAWTSGTTSLARVAGAPANVVPKEVPKEQEAWPSLGNSSQGGPRRDTAPVQTQTRDTAELAPQRAPVKITTQSGPPLENRTAVQQINISTPTLHSAEHAEKRKADAWSSSSQDSSPSASPPPSPSQSPRRDGCREVDGIVVYPEPVESPKSVLQRWDDAGRPSAARYAHMVSDAEFRAFKRAVGVVATGEVVLNANHVSAPMKKKTRSEADTPVLNQATAFQLLEELQKINLGAIAFASSRAWELPAAVRSPCSSNNAVRCFQFAQVCAPMPFLMQRV